MSVDIDLAETPSCVAHRTDDGRIAVDLAGPGVTGGNLGVETVVVTIAGTLTQLYEHVAALAVAANTVATPADLAAATGLAEPTKGDDR
jgi:hypothetical protein